MNTEVTAIITKPECAPLLDPKTCNHNYMIGQAVCLKCGSEREEGPLLPPDGRKVATKGKK